MVAELLLGGVAEAVIGYLVAEGAPSFKERLGLSRDPIKVAFDTCLHRAVIATFTQHADRKVSLFNAAFLKAAAPLLALTLTPDDNLTARDLAEAWVSYQSNQFYELKLLLLFFETFVTELRREVRVHLAYLVRERADNTVTQTEVTGGIWNEMGQGDTALLLLLREQQEAVQHLEAILSEMLHMPLTLTEGRKALLDGLNRLPTDYGTRVNNFLREYLGDHTTPRVPFGGRGEDMNALTAWLEDTNAPPYLFLGAEAGRGKSALLVRWCVALQQFSDVKVVFVPLSIRFETSAKEVFYTSLAAKLAPIYGEQVKYQTLTTDQWKGVCDSYLQKPIPNAQRVVIVIDGLDEATGWQVGRALVPLSIPPKIKIIASARIKGGKSPLQWLRQLGWNTPGMVQTMELRALTREGVENVLFQMGNPLDRLATNIDITSHLFRLTEGDPLLIHLYVATLLEKVDGLSKLNIEQLLNIEPGLAGYFDQWWEDQAQQWAAEGRDPIDLLSVRAFFNIVATSMGPLSREDVITLLRPEGVDSLQLRQIVNVMGRYIIGDGVAQGYTFSHSRLGYYFFDQLSKKEQFLWNERFVEYGKQSLQELGEHKYMVLAEWDVQQYAYVLQHFTTHLDRAKARHEEYYGLICREWASAWEALRGTYDGFLKHISRVWEVSETDPDVTRSMTIQLRCALCQASIVSLSSNIFPELLLGATQTGILSITQVIALILQDSVPNSRIKKVQLLINELSKDRNAIEQLMRFAQKAQTLSEQVAFFCALAPYLPNEIWLAVQTLEHDYHGNREKVLIALAPYLPDPHSIYREVLQSAQKLKSYIAYGEILCALAPHLPQEVWQAVQVMKGNINGDREKVLIALAPYLPDPHSIYREVLQSAQKLKGCSGFSEILCALAPHLPQEVWQANQKMGDKYFESYMMVLIALAPHLPNEVWQASKSIEDILSRYKDYWSEVLSALAPYLPNEVWQAAHLTNKSRTLVRILNVLPLDLPNKALLYQEALQAIQTIDDHRSYNNVLAALVPYIPHEIWQTFERTQGKFHDGQEKVLIALAPYLSNKVWQVAQSIENKHHQSEILSALAPYIPNEVWQATQSIKEDFFGSRTMLLIVLAPYMPNPQYFYHEALETARNVEENHVWLHILPILAEKLDNPSEVYNAAMQVARNLERGCDLLKALAPHLPDEVWNFSQTINSDYAYVEILIALAPYLPDKTYQATQSLSNDYDRARVLIALAPYLPKAAWENEVWQIINTTEDTRGGGLAFLLSGLAPYFPREIWNRMHAYTIDTFGTHAKVLIALAPYFPESQGIYMYALKATRTIPISSIRALVLATIAPKTMEPNQIYIESLNAIRNTEYNDFMRKYFVVVLTKLAQHLPMDVLRLARSVVDDNRLRLKIFSTVSKYLVDNEKANPSIRAEWTQTLRVAACRGRPTLLKELEVFMTFTMSCLQNGLEIENLTSSIIKLNASKRSLLLSHLHHLPLTTHLERIQLLDALDLPLSLRNELDFNTPQATFVAQLLTFLERVAPLPDGDTYLVRFLLYLHDVAWVGQLGHRRFVAELLGNNTPGTAQQRLAQAILEEVHAVCTWW